MLRNFIAAGHGLKQLVGSVLGMAGHKADQKVATERADLTEQVREITGLRQVLAIGVDVLAQQGDLPAAAVDQGAHVLQNTVLFPAALPAADIGDDTIRAEIVAAIHHGNPGLRTVLPDNGQPFRNGAGAVVHGKYAAVALVDFLQKLREFPQGVGPEYKIHMAVGLAHLLGHPRLLCHTAAQADHLVRIGFFRMCQRAQVAVDPLLGVVPYSAGVQRDNVGLRRIIRKGKAHLLQHAHQILTVGHILLASEGVHTGQRRMVQRLFQMPADLPGNSALPRDFFGRDYYVFAFQTTFSCRSGRCGRKAISAR